MKLDEMRIHLSNRGTVESVSNFTVKETKQPDDLIVKSAGIVVKAGLCLAALLVAFVIRIVTVQPEKVMEVGNLTHSEPAATDDIGSLRFVDATNQKWLAPVRTNDIELLRDQQMVRFTAMEETVYACMEGKVLMIEADARFGKYVRIQCKNGLETVLYGLDTVSVNVGDETSERQVIGTVPIGRSIYLSVLKNGSPQNPSDYVDLTIVGGNEAV